MTKQKTKPRAVKRDRAATASIELRGTVRVCPATYRQLVRMGGDPVDAAGALLDDLCET